MGKEKKSLGIKTTRYFTKNCSKCSFEYPNWFTNCPKCGAAWDEIEAEAIAGPKELQKKTIKIVVKITEEEFNKAIFKVNLIFSADQGKSWYQMEMDTKMDYYIAEITEIPVRSVIIYYIEVYLEDGEKIIENNDNKYYFYKVGVPIGESEEPPPKLAGRGEKVPIKPPSQVPQNYYKSPVDPPKPKTYVTREMIEQSTEIPQEQVKPSVEQTPQNSHMNNETIFGKPQTKIDPDLKVCSHCNSKIKRMWSTCPICGKNI